MFVDLVKAYDNVPREEVWYAKVWIGRQVCEMSAGSTTALMCAVGVPEGFEVKVGLHQGSAFSHCLCCNGD